jgi:hypothetical protein
MNFKRMGLPRTQFYPMSKLATSNICIFLCLLSSVPQHTSRSMHPIGVDDCPGTTSWNMSCIGVRSDRLRHISMKVFLMIRFNEAPLSISVWSTLCRPIGNLTTNGKFLSHSFISGWSYYPSGLDALSQANLMLELLSLCL